MIKQFAAAAILVALGGCTSSSLYSWGNYERDLYQYYHKADKKEQIVLDYLAFIARLERAGKKPAPGLYAEAGTFLLIAGEADKAIEFYQKEHDSWPESQPLMSRLITNLREQ